MNDAEFERKKSSLHKMLQNSEGISETDRELIATGLGRFTTELTFDQVLQRLKSKQLTESDLRTVLVVNAEVNEDLVKELLKAEKNFSVIVSTSFVGFSYENLCDD